jgi:hypothetical protein
MPNTPKLRPLRYGHPYCELCRTTLNRGDRVAWWRIKGKDGQPREAVYCADCHHANVQHGQALLPAPERTS